MNVKNKASIKFGICIGLLCVSFTGFNSLFGSTHAEAKSIEDTNMTSCITNQKFVQLEKNLMPGLEFMRLIRGQTRQSPTGQMNGLLTHQPIKSWPQPLS